MRKYWIFCLATMACGALSLAAVEQGAAGSPGRSRLSPPGQAQTAPQERHQQADRNRAVVRRVFDDLLNGGRYELVDGIYARDCPVHSGSKHARLEEAVAEGKGWRQAAPDLHMTVGEMSTRGDKVIVSWTAKGTHTGEGNGIRPTGNHVLIRGRSEFRVVDGKIAEVWNRYDRDDLFRQIGVNPRVGHLFDKAQELWSFANRMVTGEFPSFVSLRY